MTDLFARTAVPAFKLKAPSDYFSPATSNLVAAALAQDRSRFEQALATGADPNEEGPRGASNRLRPLHYAVAAGHAGAVDWLHGAGANAEQDTPGFGSALTFAVTLDSVAMLEQLVRLRGLQNIPQPTLSSLLFMTVKLPRPRSLATLLKLGVPVDLPNKLGATILIEALYAGDFDLADWIVAQGAAVNREPSKAGTTPANVLQFMLPQFKPGSPTQQQLLRLQRLMVERGVVFPVPTVQEIRAARQHN